MRLAWSFKSLNKKLSALFSVQFTAIRTGGTDGVKQQIPQMFAVGPDEGGLGRLVMVTLGTLGTFKAFKTHSRTQDRDG